MHSYSPEKTEKRHLRFFEFKKDFLKETDKRAHNWKFQIDNCPREFSQSRSLILRPEIFEIVIWSEFQLELSSTKQLDYSLSICTRWCHIIEISSS